MKRAMRGKEREVCDKVGDAIKIRGVGDNVIVFYDLRQGYFSKYSRILSSRDYGNS